MEEVQLVAALAQDFIRRHGSHAVENLYERALLATEAGCHLSAQAWYDIADAAERILERSRSRPMA